MAGFNVPIKSLTLNVQGLRCAKTRQALFRTFKLMRVDIIALQETYLLAEDKTSIEQEWKGPFHMSPATTKHSQGLLTLFNNSLNEFDITLLSSSERILSSSIAFGSETLFVTNIYSPCDTLKNRISFFDTLENELLLLIDKSNFLTDHFVVLGDFNACTNNSLDIISGHPHPNSLIKRFKSFLLSLNLNDIFRIKYPTQKSYTWTKKKVNEMRTSRRLDFVLVSESLIQFTQDIEIKGLGFSDHRAVILSCDFTSFERGPSIYKMNTNILKNKQFVDSVKTEINRTKNMSHILNPVLLWESLKAQIRGLSMQFSKTASLKNNLEKHNLTIKLKSIEDAISAGDSSNFLEGQLLKAKSELEVFTLAESRGARIRAGIKYAELGEQNNRFFLNLEKSRSVSNTIFKLKDENNIEYSTSKNILLYLKQYYEAIYKNIPCDKNFDLNNNIFLNKANIQTLNDADKEANDLEISLEEVLRALKLMKNDSSPGMDGIPTEVYKFFWNDLKDILLECFKFSFISGSLPNSQGDALISLLYKGSGAVREDIKSWRPISILNSDYKLLAKIFSLRINTVIDQLVDQNQAAFIKGRGSAFMIREIYDIIEKEKSVKGNSILLSLDYAKAFDTISTRAIISAIKLYGFGDNFVRWMEILLKNRRCCVRNAGFISNSFEMERGVRQGCPISPLLFILTLELLAANIRADPNIKGLKFPNSHRQIKIRLFADDISLFVKNLIDFREILAKIKLFSLFSGLQLNKTKSYALSLGNNEFEGTHFCGIKFVKMVKILGVFFSSSTDACSIEENFLPKLNQLEKVCTLWSKRNLSIIGKIIILKAFGISPMVHIIQSIGLMPSQINTINGILFRFLWQKKYDNKVKYSERVKRNVLCGRKFEGGLDMLNMLSFQMSFQLGWAKRLLDDEPADWKDAALHSFAPVGGLSAFRSNLRSGSFKGLGLIKNNFWRSVLQVWLDNNENNLKDDLNPLTPLFNNRDLKFKKSTLFFTQCIENNIIYVKDVVFGNSIVSYEHFKRKISVPGSLLIYNCIFNALSPKLHLYSNTTSEILFSDIEITNFGRRDFYHMLNKSNGHHSELYWSRKLESSFAKQNWLVAFRSSKETRLRVLQWKILTCTYPTSILLSKMRIRSSELCQTCKVRENLEHFFFFCKDVRKLWTQVQKYIQVTIDQSFRLSWEHAIFGILSIKGISEKKIRVVNQYILLAKLSISKMKYGKVTDPCLVFENELTLRKLI